MRKRRDKKVRFNLKLRMYGSLISKHRSTFGIKKLFPFHEDDYGYMTENDMKRVPFCIETFFVSVNFPTDSVVCYEKFDYINIYFDEYIEYEKMMKKK